MNELKPCLNAEEIKAMARDIHSLPGMGWIHIDVHEQIITELVKQLSVRAAQPENSKDHSHAGDCTIYSSLTNGSPTDGICTCGYGWSLVRKSDWSQMYSKEMIANEIDLYRRVKDKP